MHALLRLSQNINGQLRFFCQTCPYVYDLTTAVSTDMTLERKCVDDVLGGVDAWKNRPTPPPSTRKPLTNAPHSYALPGDREAPGGSGASTKWQAPDHTIG